MTVRLLESARQDLIDAFHFYESQDAGLGNRFLECLFADIDGLEHRAGVHEKRFGYHRLLARRFPFAVYYSVDRNVVTVYAVLDCRRNPTWIRSRLNGDEV